MKNDFVDKEMVQLHADGVDFIPVTFFLYNTTGLPTVYESYTKQEWEKQECILKTGRLYWKIDENGKKQYIKE